MSARDDVLAAVRTALVAGRPSEPDTPYARGGERSVARTTVGYCVPGTTVGYCVLRTTVRL